MTMPSRRATRAVRLTPRGRRARTAALVASLAVLAVLAGRSAASAADAPTQPRRVVVQPGQTLWQIAGTVDPDGDRRAVVYALRHLNGLDSAGVDAGQVLVLPGS